VTVSLADRTVVLTGAGRAGQVADLLGRDFAARGARLALLGRDPADLEARASELRALGARASWYACDLTDVDGTARAVEQLGKETDGIAHALVNLAGGFGATGPVAESAPEKFQQQIAINLTTAYVATRAMLPLVRKGRGSIVYFSSAPALPGAKTAGVSAYVAAKSAVLALMRAVSEEEVEHGVRANALAPTAIRTATNVASMGEKTRYVEPVELANVVAFLCSPLSAAVTGQVVRLEGAK
jgi:NAD(P)-dependent dehydrogenase (short-subunit alcohol dehydrogenase family)